MKSKKNIKSILIMAAVVIISLFFINMSLAANTAKINVETANLRETADENSKILEQFSINQQVEIIEQQGNWYKVKVKGITGYIREDLLDLNNSVEEKQNIEQTNTANTQNEVKQEENTTIDVQEIKLGKQKIGEDTKLKIVPVINATDTIEVKKGEEVTVTEIINGWVCIETQVTKGWIRKEKIQTTEEKQEEPKQEQTENNKSVEKVIKTLYTNSATVNLRKEPNTNCTVLASLPINTTVSVISQENGWSKVKVSGKEGYISTSLLSDKKQKTSRKMTETRKEDTQKTTTNTQTNKTNTQTTTTTTTTTATTTAPATSGNGSSVVSTAKKYIGCKYVYGGTSPSGFDCSGFTSYIYRQYGVSLNRTAAGQYSNGKAVSRSQLQPGDLVMFGKSGINHVGIYIGGGSIVHAANRTRGVTIDTINSGYYNNNYVGARRVL